MNKEVPAWRRWVSEKLNPAQPSLASREPYASPETIVDYEQAYREVEVVNRCMELIINALIEVPILVEGNGATKKIDKLLNRAPNPFEDRVKLFRRAFLDYLLDGNAFFYYDKTNLFVLPANDMEIIPDPKRFISHYNFLLRNIQSSNTYGYNRRQTTRQESELKFETDEIIHIKADNEDSIYRGAPKLKSIKRLVELYYHLINFQRQFFKNNAIPGIVLQTDSVLSPKVKERLLEQWRQSYSTIFGGARSPAILDGGINISPFGQIKFNELDFEASIERIQQDIAKALGVPYVLLKSGNNANIGANQVLFYNHTVIPILEQFCSSFAHFFGPDMIIRPDRAAVSALRADERTQALYYSTLVNTGIITPNEARTGLRFIPRDDCNDIRIPQNITGSATNPASGGRPTQQETGNTQTPTEGSTQNG
jgi:HK97 family phage portal protein